MNKKKIKENILATIIGLITVVVLLEIIFRTLLPAARLPESTFDVTYRIPKFLPGEGQYTIGKFCIKAGKWHINTEGWNSPYEYENDSRPKVAIIGDSYVEAFQVDVEKSVGPVLQNLTGSQYHVMSFGTSGAPLSQYLQLSRYAQKFKPEIIVFNLVHNDFDESIAPDNTPATYLHYFQVNDSTFKECDIQHLKKKGLVSTLLNYSATGRYLLHNLKIQEMNWGTSGAQKKATDSLPLYNANIDVKKVTALRKEITVVTDQAIRTLRAENPDTRIIFMMDGLRKEIYENTPVEQSNIRWMTTMVSELCHQHGVEFIDLTEAFAADYQKNNTHFEYPHDWHWNEYGHRIAAQALYQQITSKTN